MSTWKPIESAPHDGTAILVVQAKFPGGKIDKLSGWNTYVAAWWSDEDGSFGAWMCYMDKLQEPRCPIQPTHWMPLPEPPA